MLPSGSPFAGQISWDRAETAAREVGHKLQWDIIDHEILDVMAEKYGMPHEATALLDEKHPSWLEDWFTRWFAGKSYSASAYFHRLKRLFALVRHVTA